MKRNNWRMAKLSSQTEKFPGLFLAPSLTLNLNEKLQLLSFSLQGKMNAKGYPVGLPGDMETASRGYNTCQQRLSLLLMAATLLLLVFTTMSKIFCLQQLYNCNSPQLPIFQPSFQARLSPNALFGSWVCCSNDKRPFLQIIRSRI